MSRVMSISAVCSLVCNFLSTRYASILACHTETNMPTTNYRVTHEQISSVLHHASITDELKSVTRIENGFNPIYNVTTANAQYILKITNPTWKVLKTRNEAVVLQFLSQHTSIPVPSVYSFSDTTDLIGYEYILMSYVPGVAFSDIYDQLSLKEKEPYLRQIAHYYVDIIDINIESQDDNHLGCFKNIEKIGDKYVAKLCANVDSLLGPYKDLYDYIIEYIHFRFVEMSATKYSHYIPRFEAIIKKLKLQQEQSQFNERLVLTHTDIAPKNIIVDPKTSTVNGIIDWEWACMMLTDQDFTTMTEEAVWGDEQAILLLRQQVLAIMGEERFNRYKQITDQRRDMMDAVSVSMCVVSYPDWYMEREEQIPEYENNLEKNIENLFTRYGV
jgi:aminoglycoside phosphotransferase